MATNEVPQVEFIKELLRRGIKRGEILAKFVEKWQKVSDRTFDRRLKQAQKEVGIELAAIKEQVNESIEQEVSARKSSILSYIERQEILTQIALGQIPLTKPIVVSVGNGAGSVIEHVECVPDWMDRKNAIAELNKMDGSYAATKLSVDTEITKIIIEPATIKGE